jgi:hypothetical protein
LGGVEPLSRRLLFSGIGKGRPKSTSDPQMKRHDHDNAETQRASAGQDWRLAFLRWLLRLLS